MGGSRTPAVDVDVFNRKDCQALIEGEDPVDDVREAYPTHDRFVLCDEKNNELGRFVLLEDANAAARKLSFKTVVFAIKSGKAMSFTAPGGGTVRGKAAALNR